MRHLVFIKNQSGVSIAEVLVSVALIAVMASAFASSYAPLQIENKKASVRRSMKIALDQIAEILREEGSWETTRDSAGNSDFRCARPQVGIACNNGEVDEGMDFFLDGAAVPYYTTKTVPNVWGFDMNGDPCDTFDPVDGNDDCPLRVEVVMRISCNINLLAPGCKSRAVVFEGRGVYRAQNMMAVNVGAEGFLVTRYVQLAEETNCLNNNGVYNENNDGKCRLPFMNTEKKCERTRVAVAIKGGVLECVDPSTL